MYDNSQKRLLHPTHQGLVSNEHIADGSHSTTPSTAETVLVNGDQGPWGPHTDPETRYLFPVNVRGSKTSSNILDAEVAELFSRCQLQEEEILLLQKQIADASIKELRLLQEKHVLERKLLDLRMAIDEKSINAVSDDMKNLMLRKNYLEDNLKLADELKVLDDEQFIFSSSLLSLLAEYGTRPSMLDASSISNSTKHLYNQLRWKIGTSQASNVHAYHQYNQPPNDKPMLSQFGKPRLNQDIDMVDLKDATTRNTEMHQPSPNKKLRNIGVSPAFLSSEDKIGKQIERRPSFKFSIPSKHQTNASYDSDGERLPGVEGFQISGDARPGGKLTACGFPVNGTSLCIFQWVRHFQDGTCHYIDGTSSPDYVVTADDVDTLIAVECTPMDDNQQQGELVREFANNHNKIACDPEMQQEIEKHVSGGLAMFKVLLLKDPSAEVWELATIILKKSCYAIKVNQMDKMIIEEKYSTDLSIKIPIGFSTQFVLTCSDGTSHPFTTDGISRSSSAENDIRLRDIIVLTMRSFQSKAMDDKKKGKARSN